MNIHLILKAHSCIYSRIDPLSVDCLHFIKKPNKTKQTNKKLSLDFVCVVVGVGVVVIVCGVGCICLMSALKF